MAREARQVQIEETAIPSYASVLALSGQVAGASGVAASGSERERLAAHWLTLDAINFGSGWFPTLHKREGRSGYHTIATAIAERFEVEGPWSAQQLSEIRPADLAAVMHQDPKHELMGLFAASLRDLGSHLLSEHDGIFASPLARAGDSAVALTELLARWECFADASIYRGRTVPFLKRAQIAAADVHRAGAATFDDIARLTMFADNLVPHVLRLDGVLRFAPALVARIDREELIVHGSSEEVEIRACAVHAVELIVAATPGTCAAEVDQVLWHRGGGPRYKASPRHRCRCTAY